MPISLVTKHAQDAASWADHRITSQALKALRPLVESESAADIGRVFQGFATALEASHHMFAVVDRGSKGGRVRWICDDAAGWWKGLRSELGPLMAVRTGGAVRLALGEADGLSLDAGEALCRQGAHSAMLLAAETATPGNVVGCLALLFDKGREAARRSRHEHLVSLCDHAAGLALDSYLKLPAPVPAPALPPAPIPASLSRREIECLKWAAVGKTSWETAGILGVSGRTINFHLGNAFSKLEVNNKQAAVAQAIMLGLI